MWPPPGQGHGAGASPTLGVAGGAPQQEPRRRRRDGRAIRRQEAQDQPLGRGGGGGRARALDAQLEEALGAKLALEAAARASATPRWPRTSLAEATAEARRLQGVADDVAARAAAAEVALT